MILEELAEKMMREKAQREAIEEHPEERRLYWIDRYSEVSRYILECLKGLINAGVVNTRINDKLVTHETYGPANLGIVSFTFVDVPVEIVPGLKPLAGCSGSVDIRVQPRGKQGKAKTFYDHAGLGPGTGQWMLKVTDAPELIAPLTRIDANFVPLTPELVKGVLAKLLT